MLTEKVQRKTYTVCCHLYVESKKYNKLVNVRKKKQTFRHRTNQQLPVGRGQFRGRSKIKTLVIRRLCEIIDENCEAQQNLKSLSFNLKKSWHYQATPSFLTFFLCFQYHHTCLFFLLLFWHFLLNFFHCLFLLSLSLKFNYFSCVLSLLIYHYPFFLIRVLEQNYLALQRSLLPGEFLNLLSYLCLCS